MKHGFKGWQRVLLIIIPYILIITFFQSLGMMLSGISLLTINPTLSSVQQLIISASGLMGNIFIFWFFMKFVDQESWKQMGFYTKNRVSDLFTGIGIGLVIMLAGYYLLLILDEIYFKELVFNPVELLIAVLLFVIVAFVEETLLRGYVLRNLMLSFNKYSALLVSSVLFAAMHAFNPNVDFFSLFNIFLAGILLGISYLYTKNLWFPIGLHFGWNLFQSLFGFNVSGQDFYSIVEYTITEPTLWNGGNFGFEGSFFSIIFQLITITAIVGYYNRHRNIV